VLTDSEINISIDTSAETSTTVSVTVSDTSTTVSVGHGACTGVSLHEPTPKRKRYDHRRQFQYDWEEELLVVKGTYKSRRNKGFFDVSRLKETFKENKWKWLLNQIC
jgi:hypothetical protein